MLRTGLVQQTDQIVASHDLSLFVREAVADLRNVLLTGELGGARIVHIERLNIQVNTGPGTAIQVNEVDLEKLPAEWRALLRRRDGNRKSID